MKLISAIIAMTFCIFQSQAQQVAKIKPELKAGTVLEYEINAQGQTLPLTMKIASLGEDGISFDYDMQNGMAGKFVNTKINLEKGNNLNWDNPEPGEARILPDNQTLAVLSRPFLKELKLHKKSTYDGMELMLKDLPKGTEVISAGKEIDAIYAENADGSVKYWILNNDQFPLLLKIDGNPMGINLVCKEIKN